MDEFDQKMEISEQPQEEIVEKIPGRDVYETVSSLVSALLVVVLVFTFLVRLMGVSGPSMIPTLQDGDRLLVVNSLLCGDYQVGDIVIARKETFDSKPIVKRVIATAGQTVDIDFNLGQVYVDGELLDEDYINDYTYREEGTVFPLTVPEGEVFLMGDNRNHSNDSRDSSLGTVDTRLLIGKAVFLVFPGRDYLTEQRDDVLTSKKELEHIVAERRGPAHEHPVVSRPHDQDPPHDHGGARQRGRRVRNSGRAHPDEQPQPRCGRTDGGQAPFDRFEPRRSGRP